MKIGRYEIVGRLGKGGFGVVWKGFDPLLKRSAAIKVISEEAIGDRESVERFLREASTAGQMQHRNVVTIFDLGEHEGRPYIAMEFLEGDDLADIIGKKEPLPIERKIDIIRQVAEGLHYAHEHGIVHRDIKPANIRVLADGTAKIMDFGVAKVETSDMTRTGQVIGTVTYMAPEQLNGQKVDARSDLFSLGVVFHELLTYRRPFPGNTVSQVMLKILHSEPEPLQIGLANPEVAALEEVTRRLLAKDPNQRFQSALDFAEVLEDFLAGTPMPLRRTAKIHGKPDTARTRPELEPTRAAGPPDSGSRKGKPLLQETALIEAKTEGRDNIGSLPTRTVEPPAEPKRRRTALVVAGTVAAVLILLAAAGIVYRLFFSTGTVEVRVTPAAASVLVDDDAESRIDVGPSGTVTLDLKGGAHSVMVEAKGYKPATRSVTVKTRSSATLDIALEPLAQGCVRLLCRPAARISGIVPPAGEPVGPELSRRIGTWTPTVVKAPAGSYKFTFHVSYNGVEKDLEETITVPLDEDGSCRTVVTENLLDL